MIPAPVEDLAILVADLDAEMGIKALLQPAPNLGWRAVSARFFRHRNRDNGVFSDGHNLLPSQSRLFHYAVAIRDLEGCGREKRLERKQVEAKIEERLCANGWDGRAAAVVIAPELEAWVWGDWHALALQAEWSGGAPALREWLLKRDLIFPGQPKPGRPKESLERVLRQTNKSASASLFQALGQAADIDSCADPAFGKLISTLREWFPSR